MTHAASGNLGPFYRFFHTYGSERLNGLNASHFAGLSAAEKEEAWNYLKQDFASSDERIAGLYLLDPCGAVALFKEALTQPMEMPPYAASREAMESSRLFLLTFVHSVEHDKQYVDAMAGFAGSAYENVRTLFANAAPIHQATPALVAALKEMILTETERIPLSAAITKFMVIHGMAFDAHDPAYKKIYMSLRADDLTTRMACVRLLEERQAPDDA